MQIRKAIQSTLILFPLLGITNLLFFINPKRFKRSEDQFIYMLVNSVLKSSQVFFKSFISKPLNLFLSGHIPVFFVLLFQLGSSEYNKKIIQKKSHKIFCGKVSYRVNLKSNHPILGTHTHSNLIIIRL